MKLFWFHLENNKVFEFFFLYYLFNWYFNTLLCKLIPISIFCENFTFQVAYITS